MRGKGIARARAGQARRSRISLPDRKHRERLRSPAREPPQGSCRHRLQERQGSLSGGESRRV